MANTDLFPDGILGNDNAVELFAKQPADMTGWKLCTNGVCKDLRGMMDGQSYSVFYQARREVNLPLSRGEVVLYNANTVPWTAIDAVSWGVVVGVDQCLARVYDGAAAWTEKRWPTMGFGNSAWSTTPTPTVTPAGG